MGQAGKNNEHKRSGEFKDSEFDFQTGWYVDGQPASEMAVNPVQTLEGTGLKPGQTVLEVGCGTGFFTIPAARLIGENGRLVALDVSSGFIKESSKSRFEECQN